MPRVIFKCPYIKPGTKKAAAHLGNYVRYAATREGVDKLAPDKSALPATDKQRDMIEQSYKSNMHSGNLDKAVDCMEQVSALALAVYGRELRQLGESCTTNELSEALCSRILPHQNHGSLKNRHAELAAQFQSVLAKASASGIRSEAEKHSLAENWLELAVSFAKVPVKYEADILKQQQKQGQTTLQLKMG